MIPTKPNFLEVKIGHSSFYSYLVIIHYVVTHRPSVFIFNHMICLNKIIYVNDFLSCHVVDYSKTTTNFVWKNICSFPVICE